MAVIQAKIHWLKAIDPDTKYAPSWQVTVELSPEQIAKINKDSKSLSDKAKPITTYERDGMEGRAWILTLPTHAASGKENEPPKIVNRKANRLAEKDIRRIGNGTLANVMYSAFAYNTNGGGVIHRFQGLQVIKLEVYEAQEDFESLDSPAKEEGETFAPVGDNDDY